MWNVQPRNFHLLKSSKFSILKEQLFDFNDPENIDQIDGFKRINADNDPNIRQIGKNEMVIRCLRENRGYGRMCFIN